MPVANTNAYSGPLYGTGSATAFAFNFKAMSTSEVAAQVDGVIVDSSTYTVTLTDSGGTVTFNTAPADGAEVYILSNPSFLQQINFDNQGSFAPTTQNQGLDRAVVRDLYLKDRLDRALVAPPGNTVIPLGSITEGDEGRVLAVIGGKVAPIDNNTAAVAADVLAAQTAATQSGSDRIQTASDAAAADFAKSVVVAAQNTIVSAVGSGLARLYASVSNALSNGVVDYIFTAGSGASADGNYQITLSGGGGSGASAFAVVKSGAITKIVIQQRGHDYTAAPTATFTIAGLSGASVTPVIGPNTVAGDYFLVENVVAKTEDRYLNTGSGASLVYSGGASVDTAGGLFFRSDGTLSAWSGATSSWATLATPALPAFDRSPIPAQTPISASPDAGGAREGCLFIDDDGTWYMIYDSGDGSATDAGGPWRPYISSSVDEGLTWTKLGPMSMGLAHGYDSGSYPSTAIIYIEKRNGTYYFHRMTAGSVSQNQISGLPYTSDLWSCSTINGTYTYVTQTVANGTSGAFDNPESPASCIVYDGISTYYLFYSTYNGTKYNVGLATSSSPTGPFTKTGTPVFATYVADISGENPQVYWHPGLNCWVMLVNMVSGSKTVKNRALFSNSLTDWSKATYHDFTPISPMSGLTAVGMARGFLSSSTSVTRQSVLDMVSNSAGAVPIVYDSSPTDSNHIGRKLYYTTLEASPAGLLSATNRFKDTFQTETAGNLGGQNGWVSASGAATQPQIIAGSILDMGSVAGTTSGIPMVVRTYGGPATSIMQRAVFTVSTASGISFVFAYQAGAGLGTWFQCAFGATSITVSKWSNVTGTTLYTAGSGLTLLIPHTCEAVYNNGTFYLYVDKSQVGSFTLSSGDQTTMAAGGQVGLANGFGGTTERYVSQYTVASPIVASTSPIFLALAHTGFVMEFAIKSARWNDGYLDLFFFCQSGSDTNNCYRARLDFTFNNPLLLDVHKRVGGSETLIANTSSTRTQSSDPNLYAAIRVTAIGTVIKIEVNGEVQFLATDAQWTSGVAVAASGQGEIDIRSFAMRRSNDVTVNGLIAGQAVTLRGPGGYPIATTTATGAAVTLTAPHYPAASIDVAGIQRYSPTGGIWGGDVFN